MSLEIFEVSAGEARFAACMAIRLEVFVAEQNVPVDEEHDGKDETARHFLAELDGTPVGTARVLLKAEGAKITRVAVRRAARGQGIGEALMRYIEANVAAAQYRLDAQVTALRFYENLGYFPEGENFIEAGMAHRHMVKITPAVALQAGILPL